jgi:hydroxymethylbilane synthase
MLKTLRIATRKSPLALWQAEHVADLMISHYPQLSIELIPMSTLGDRQLEASLSDHGGKGLFIKELEQTLYDGRADIAVHSMKDMTITLPEKLGIAAVLPRENPSDAFVSNHYRTLDEVPMGEVIGTSSLRRQAFISAIRPDIQVKLCRGNVGTRLEKLDQGEYAGLILAYAGLKRLNLLDRVGSIFPTEMILPAIGQGTIGIECHEDNHPVWNLISSLNDTTTHYCLMAERAMNLGLNGGCRLPVAGYAILREEQLWLRGVVATSDGYRILRAEKTGALQDAERIGRDVARELIEQGADQIIARARYE